MLFQSQVFCLVFMPTILGVYWLFADRMAVRQWSLIAASLLFYGWWDVRFLPLLIGHALITWLIAVEYKRTGRGFWIWIGIGLNLLSLGSFKYLSFLVESLEAASGLDLPTTEILLPIGISFFTFQLISYLVDLKRGDAPVYGFRPFFLFATFFPQLIAGPIVRHNQIISQFTLDPRRPEAQYRFAAGALLFTIGFAKKIFIADRLVRVVDPVFEKATTGALSFGEAWTGTLGFTFQLFLDFSAYTEMAIGLGLLFGFLLPENFNRPYLATSLRDFWRRWHITLSTFLRDYVYIPFGGSQKGAAAYVMATLLTMGLCGLWHGAGWTFVAWGFFHGIGLVVCRAWQQTSFSMPAPLAWSITLLFVMIGWVLFRAVDFQSAITVLTAAAGLNGFEGSLESSGLIAVAAVVSIGLPSAHTLIRNVLSPRPILAAATALMLTVCVLESGNAPPAAFIYFQF
ncbi:MAG: MBOAT family O-acyltransferase [Pseudomonadota bacterium]